MTDDSPTNGATTETLLTTAEVATLLGVSKKWVRTHSDGDRKPRLPCIDLAEGKNKLRRFRRSDIEKFLEARTEMAGESSAQVAGCELPRG